jgi:hypothetical protein
VANGQPVSGLAAQPGQYLTSARAAGTVVGSQPALTVMATDPANYFGSAPGVRIVKAINATDPNHPTAIEDANTAPGPAFVKGTSVIWTYQVFNTGNVPVSITSLKDNNGTPTVTTDDWSPAPVLSGGYNVGDLNHNNLLDTNEVWLYTSQGVKNYTVAIGQYSNIGTVTAQDPNTSQTVAASDVNYHWGQSKGEGLTPGFWKNNADSNGAVAWPRFPDRTGPLVYSPTQLLGSVFNVPSSLGLGNIDLDDTLNLGGAGAQALPRMGVAALLNATHPRVAYPLTARQVIDQVNAALASGNATTIENLKNQLDSYNNLGSDLDQYGNTTGPQLAAAAPTGPQLGVSLLTEAQLTPIVVEALALWSGRTDMPALSLKDVHIAIADLPDGSAGQLPVLGYTAGTILIDVNAGGFGWFIDPTPADNSEFAATDSSNVLTAPADSPAYGRMDLLTVVLHELGHVFGLEDLGAGDDAHDLMAATLLPGERRLPGRGGLPITPIAPKATAADAPVAVAIPAPTPGNSLRDLVRTPFVVAFPPQRQGTVVIPPSVPVPAAVQQVWTGQARTATAFSPLDLALFAVDSGKRLDWQAAGEWGTWPSGGKPPALADRHTLDDFFTRFSPQKPLPDLAVATRGASPANLEALLGDLDNEMLAEVARFWGDGPSARRRSG